MMIGFTRREFIKGLTASAALVCSGFALAGNQTVVSKVAIEKSIKASFGGGFSLISYSKSGATIEAIIENFGNQYTVTSVNVLDWKIIQSSLTK